MAKRLQDWRRLDSKRHATWQSLPTPTGPIKPRRLPRFGAASRVSGKSLSAAQAWGQDRVESIDGVDATHPNSADPDAASGRCRRRQEALHRLAGIRAAVRRGADRPGPARPATGTAPLQAARGQKADAGAGGREGFVPHSSESRRYARAVARVIHGQPGTNSLSLVGETNACATSRRSFFPL